MTPNLTNNNSTGPGALSGPTMGANEREKQAKEKTPDKNTSIKGIKTFFFSTIERDRKREEEPAFQWAVLGKHRPHKRGTKSKRMIWIYVGQWNDKGSLFLHTLVAMTHSQRKVEWGEGGGGG